MNTISPQMNATSHRVVLNDISSQVIGAAYVVSNALGVGFLEKVYENALCWEIRKQGLEVHQQRPFEVQYDGRCVGEYIPDLIVANKVIVEIKVADTVDAVYRTQCLNYLRATGLKLCVLLNFGRPRLQVARFVHQF